MDQPIKRSGVSYAGPRCLARDCRSAGACITGRMCAELERKRHEQGMRLQIVQALLGSDQCLHMTPAEVVAAATTVEEFVLGSAGASDRPSEELLSAILHAERSGVFRDGLVNSLAAVRAAGNVSR